MKNTLFSAVCFLLMTLVLSCQDKQTEEVTTRSKSGAGRRACGNSILFKFVYPFDGYSYGPDGCVTYFIQKGVTKQFKVVMSNIGITQTLEMRVTFPNQPNSFRYEVASVTGGVIGYEPNGISGAAIRWTADQMIAGTTYEMTLNITGGYGSAENGVSLESSRPCSTERNYDCDADENLHLVLID